MHYTNPAQYCTDPPDAPSGIRKEPSEQNLRIQRARVMRDCTYHSRGFLRDAKVLRALGKKDFERVLRKPRRK